MPAMRVFKRNITNKKKKNKSMANKIKSLSEEIIILKQENKQILEKKTLDFLNNFEKIDTSKIKNISELSELVMNSVNIFHQSQNNLQNLIEKLIKISDNEHKSLLDESKKYIDTKGKVFFDTLEKLSISNKKDEISEENKIETKKGNINRETEINELKKNYELSRQRENMLKDKIRALEEKNNAIESLNKSLQRTFDEIYSKYAGTDDTKKKK